MIARFRPGLASLLVVVLLLAAAGSAQAASWRPNSTGSWASTCANRDVGISRLGLAKAELAMVCVWNQARRRFLRRGPLARNRYLKRAATTVMRANDFRISRIIAELNRAGYFSNGGKGFARCSPLSFSGADTPEQVALAIYNREGFIFDRFNGRPLVDVGVALKGRRVFVLTGRRT